jgi:putative membrane protein
MIMSAFHRCHHRRLWTAALAAVLVVGCASSDDGDAISALETQGEEEGAALAAQLDLATDSPEAAKIVAELTAAIVCAINEGEVMASIPAFERGNNGQVVRFAEKMIEDHQRASRTFDLVLQQQDLKPLENPISTVLRVEALTATVELSTADDAELDRMYIEKQVKGHAKARALLGALAVANDNEAVQRYLNQQIAAVDAHLLLVIQIARGLHLDEQPDSP